jgi:hypothetical protein
VAVVTGAVVYVIVVSAVAASVAALGVVQAVKLKINTMINIRLNSLSLCLIFYPF